jgi:glycosyltransferase involved in cell wall biosynthesis
MLNKVQNGLPSPPVNKKGWPWTGENLYLNEIVREGFSWPKVSIVMPSYNQGKFIEESIRSVLLQGYPNLELIVIDGGSTDGTLNILQKYSPWLYYYVSEPDRGQSHAINKGLAVSTGDVQAWINTDDLYFPGALLQVGKRFYEELDFDVLYGNAVIINETGKRTGEILSVPFNHQAFLHGTVHLAVQSAVFWRRDLFQRVGGVNEDLHYAMDVDMYVRFIAAGGNFRFLHTTLGAYRLYGESKTIANPEQSSIEAAAIPSINATRCRKGYFLRRYLYKIRQFAWLVIQGDFPYIFARAFSRIARKS